jgi:enoyl-CoA hydratase/carnithine racemase
MTSVLVETRDRVTRIELARLDKKNALTQEMYGAMSAALAAAEADPAVRAILIHGARDCFTAGNDLKDFLERSAAGGPSAAFGFISALPRLAKPLVAAVGGAAVGIGTTMLLHCDFVYVSDEARLAMPFVALGLVPEFASSLIVPQLMGHRRAADKLLLGDPFTPEQAVECGIASAVLPAGEVVNHARRVAERFNALPPGAVRETKQLLRGPQAAQQLEVMRTESAIFARRLRSPEAMEAFQAFFQKRKPDFGKF